MHLAVLDYLYNPNPPYVIQQILDLYRQGYSVIVLLCSRTRGGKSSKGFVIANWLTGSIFGKAWDWRNNTILDVDDVLDKLGNGVYLMDEVQLLLSRKRSMTAPSQLVYDFTSSQAYKHFILLLICPRANTLGIDHANELNFVIPIHYRTTLIPYKVKANEWNLTADPRKIPRENLGSWDLDLKNPFIKYAFKEELTELEDFIKYIEINIKQKKVEEMKERRGHSYIIDKKTGERMLLKPRTPLFPMEKK